MRNLFRSFERERVRYLVISGQACVLYGASAFSQDLDLWVDPTPRNLRAVVNALARRKARVHKLTPPLTRRNFDRGHGFHFIIPAPGSHPVYLDLMGRPPRVGRFAHAFRRQCEFATPWGRLPVVSIEDLVEIKKTNRPADYDVITRLALLRLRQRRGLDPAVVRWALPNLFQSEALWEAVRESAPEEVARFPAARRFYRIWRDHREPSPDDFARVDRILMRAARALMDAGRRYWTPRLEELRRWRRRGKLLEEGTPVARLA